MGPRIHSFLPPSRPCRGLALALLGVATACPTLPAEDASPPSGEGIYRERCASCHGPSGEGVKGKHAQPLAGDKSVLQLARYIEKNMPEDKPGTCTGEEALAVARHVHESFYSPLARARNSPA